MKTLLATLALIVLTTLSVYAGGNKSKIGPANKAQTVWDNNAVVFAYNVGPGASYRWRQENGPAQANLIGTSTPTLLVSNLAPGTYYFALTTTTPAGDSTTDRMVLKVKDPETVTKF